MSETRETVDIETAGATVTLNLSRNSHLGIYVRGDSGTDYALDVSDEQGNWIQTVEDFAAVGEINYRGVEPARWVRLRVTAGTGVAGESADVFLSGTE